MYQRINEDAQDAQDIRDPIDDGEATSNILHRGRVEVAPLHTDHRLGRDALHAPPGFVNCRCRLRSHSRISAGPPGNAQLHSQRLLEGAEARQLKPAMLSRP